MHTWRRLLGGAFDLAAAAVLFVEAALMGCDREAVTSLQSARKECAPAGASARRLFSWTLFSTCHANNGKFQDADVHLETN